LNDLQVLKGPSCSAIVPSKKVAVVTLQLGFALWNCYGSSFLMNTPADATCLGHLYATTLL
jgi:hypothetical protein